MLGCVFVYYLMRLMRVPDHSWYLTLYSSGVTSFFGVYFFYHVCVDGFMQTITNEQDITRYIAIFFIGYCIMDLMIGEAHNLQAQALRSLDDETALGCIRGDSLSPLFFHPPSPQ
jgi:hypothetical protein